MDLHKKISNGDFLGYIKIIEDNVKKRNNYPSLANAYSFIGNYKKSQEIYFTDSHLIEEVLSENESFNKQNLEYEEITTDKLLIECKKNDFVLFNEAHHKPQHRIFVKNKLSELYKLGFRYLFVEALYDKGINERQYPTIKSLTYKEPSFGLLLREALNNGFKIYGYEKRNPKDMQDRENGMFENIKSVLDTLPKAKSVLFGGYSHISTSQVEGNIISLGNLLKNDYKVISIDQTIYTEEHNPKLEKNFYKTFSKDITESKILKVNSDFWYDFTVVHPRTTYNKTNTANWYFKNNKTLCLNLNKVKTLDKENEYLLQLYLEKEYDITKNKSLPIYQMVIKKKFKKVELPKYDFNNIIVVIRKDDGNIIYNEKLK